jgi:hypothetical protein
MNKYIVTNLVRATKESWRCVEKTDLYDRVAFDQTAEG